MTASTLPPLSVLVVEDQEDGADSLAALLRLYGHRVRIARTGGAALELAADDPPDVVLLDIRLPGLDGWQVARWLREQVGNTEKRPLLVALTGGATDEDRQRSADVGMDLHLVKPVDPAVLSGVLERFRRVLAPPSDITPFPDGRHR